MIRVDHVTCDLDGRTTGVWDKEDLSWELMWVKVEDKTVFICEHEPGETGLLGPGEYISKKPIFSSLYSTFFNHLALFVMIMARTIEML